MENFENDKLKKTQQKQKSRINEETTDKFPKISNQSNKKIRNFPKKKVKSEFYLFNKKKKTSTTRLKKNKYRIISKCFATTTITFDMKCQKGQI